MYQVAEGWDMESTRAFGLNVICSTFVSEMCRKVIIGVYIPPSKEDESTLDHIKHS